MGRKCGLLLLFISIQHPPPTIQSKAHRMQTVMYLCEHFLWNATSKESTHKKVKISVEAVPCLNLSHASTISSIINTCLKIRFPFPFPIFLRSFLLSIFLSLLFLFLSTFFFVLHRWQIILLCLSPSSEKLNGIWTVERKWMELNDSFQSVLSEHLFLCTFWFSHFAPISCALCVSTNSKYATQMLLGVKPNGE